MGSQRAYYEYMGYATSELARRYQPYATRFSAGGRVLDVGCGRGEFLELLVAQGVDAVGIDIDAEMIDEVRRKGLNAEVAEAVAYLEAHAASLHGVFAAHLIEHLPPSQMQALVRAAVGALKEGGRLVLVTPNPHSLEVQLYEFWTDLQHVRFYTPDILRWVLHDAGLREIESGDNPEYRSARGLRPEPPGVPPAGPPARAATPLAGLSRSARLRQRLAGWLQPTSTLERLHSVEDRVAALEATARHEASALGDLSGHLSALFPPGEFFVTGVK